MWKGLLDLLPDWGWTAPFVVVRDILSLGLAALGSYLAWRAIKMGDVQTRIGHEQMEIAKRQEALDIEQGKIAKRQAEIAENQHQILQEQVAKKTDLRMMVQGVNRQFSSNKDLRSTIRFHVHNGGNKSADGFYWELLIPEDIAHWVEFVDEDGQKLKTKISHQSETEHYQKLDGHYTHKLWGFTGLEIARISFDTRLPKLNEFTLKWRIRAEDGMVPPEGLAFIKLQRLDDLTYAWSEWHPGQKESDIS